MDALPAFVLAALALAGSPGPNTLSLAATGAAFGARRGLPYLAGLVAGMLGVIALTMTGLIGLLLAVPGARIVITVLAAAYFVYLAWKIATAPPLSDDRASGRPPRFGAGVALSLVNPKAYAAMAALYSGFVLAEGTVVLDAALKTAVITVILVGVNFAWLFAGAALTRLFRQPRANRAINIAFAAALLLSVAAVLML